LDNPCAEITIVMYDRSTWFIPIILNENGDPGIQMGTESPLPLIPESFYAFLWLEAMARLSNIRD